MSTLEGVSQFDRVRVIEWFLSTEPEARRTGRSYTVAVALIRIAARTLRQVRFVDHVTNRRSVVHIEVLVSQLVNDDPRLQHRYSRGQHNSYFVLNLLAPIDDWLPYNGLEDPSSVGNDLKPPTHYQRLREGGLLLKP